MMCDYLFLPAGHWYMFSLGHSGPWYFLFTWPRHIVGNRWEGISFKSGCNEAHDKVNLASKEEKQIDLKKKSPF